MTNDQKEMRALAHQIANDVVSYTNYTTDGDDSLDEIILARLQSFSTKTQNSKPWPYSADSIPNNGDTSGTPW